MVLSLFFDLELTCITHGWRGEEFSDVRKTPVGGGGIRRGGQIKQVEDLSADVILG